MGRKWPAVFRHQLNYTGNVTQLLEGSTAFINVYGCSHYNQWHHIVVSYDAQLYDNLSMVFWLTKF